MQASQSVFSRLSLPGFLQSALIDEGFKQLSDFDDVTPEELAADLKVGRDVAMDIIRQVESCRAGPSRSQLPRSTPTLSQAQPPLTSSQLPPPISSQSVSSLLHQNGHNPQSTAPAWSTGSEAMDELLRPLKSSSRRREAEEGVKARAKGVQPGMIVEVAAPPGSGKTGLMVSVVVNARMHGGGGEGSEVLIVDTEGSITPSKIKSAMKARSTEENPMDLDEALKGIYLIRATTQTEFLAFWHTMEMFLQEHDKVKLVVIDTLSYHFRHPNTNLNLRKRFFELVKTKLAKVSTTYGCAILIANQMATKLLTAENKPATFDTGDKAVMMPQLGDAWMPPKTVKIVLFRSGMGFGERFAFVARRPGETEDRPWAEFDVDDNGQIQDVLYD